MLKDYRRLLKLWETGKDRMERKNEKNKNKSKLKFKTPKSKVYIHEKRNKQ